MRKRVLLIMAVVLALSTTAPAADFWAGLLNGAFQWGPGSNDDSSYGWIPGTAAGYQYAAVQGAPAGGGLVLQAEGAVGLQDSDDDSQEQGMAAGMGQFVGAANGGSAVGLQAGGASQTQTGDVGTQSSTVGGVQYAYVSTGPGGSATATQTAVVLVYQNQEQTEAPE